MKRFVITEDEKNHIQKMYGLINEQDVEQINDPKIINAVTATLKKLMMSPKFSTDDMLFKLIEEGKLVKAYRLHRNLNTNVDYVDYELLDDMLNNPETKDIVRLLPNLKNTLINYYS